MIIFELLFLLYWISSEYLHHILLFIHMHKYLFPPKFAVFVAYILIAKCICVQSLLHCFIAFSMCICLAECSIMIRCWNCTRRIFRSSVNHIHPWTNEKKKHRRLLLPQNHQHQKQHKPCHTACETQSSLIQTHIALIHSFQNQTKQNKTKSKQKLLFSDKLNDIKHCFFLR